MLDDWRLLAAPVTHILSRYWRASRWLLALVAVTVLVSSIGAIAAPYLFSRLIDRLTADRFAAHLALGLGLYAALVGVVAATQRMVQYLSFVSAQNLNFIASTAFFARLLRKRAAFFIEHNPAEIESAGSRGQEALMVVVQTGLISLIPGFLSIALALVLMGATLDLTVVVIVVVYGSGYIALTMIANRRTRHFLDTAIEAGQVNAKFVGNAMTAMETLRHFGSHGWMQSRFDARAAEERDNWAAYCLRRMGYVAVTGAGLAVQFVVTFLLLIPRYQAGAISVGDIVLFNMLILQLNQPFEMIAYAIDDIVRARADLMPLARFWAAPEEPSSEGRDFEPHEGSLRFEDVTYRHENGRGVDAVSFTAKRGRITFLVGETGSGKSTLVRLALKSLVPQGGRITVDKQDLTALAQDAWYAAVGVVPQEPVLLNDTLSTNILLGRPLDEARLRRAAGKAAILDFVDALPEGFATVLGERGMKLSGGDRQRIAIARALYGDPAFLFLDEASSALDEATEAGVMAHIRSLADEVTILAVTHRKGVISHGDHVIRLDDGRCAEAK